uniref:Uncharacterized protein n=1 Tax=Romanomermis culicivorax TaxID=13658 RepID=A0A915JS94_ROMCU
MLNSMVQIKQSQSDRKLTDYEPARTSTKSGHKSHGKDHKFSWRGRHWPPPPPPLPPDAMADMLDGRPPLPPPLMPPIFDDNSPFLSYKRKFLGVPILYACKFANPRKCMTYCCRDPFISFKIVENGSAPDDWTNLYSSLYSSNDQNSVNSSDINTREIIIRTKIVDQDRDFLGYLKPQFGKGSTSSPSKFKTVDPFIPTIKNINIFPTYNHERFKHAELYRSHTESYDYLK